MGALQCVECGSLHRTEEQYKKHLSSSVHRDKPRPESLWYIGRVGNSEGVFFQTQILDVNHVPTYTVERKRAEEKIAFTIKISKKEEIIFVLGKKEIDQGLSFDYFDVELCVYSVYLMFK